jgi:hypothetical protein
MGITDVERGEEGCVICYILWNLTKGRSILKVDILKMTLPSMILLPSLIICFDEYGDISCLW